MLAKVNPLGDLDFNLQVFVNMENYIISSDIQDLWTQNVKLWIWCAKTKNTVSDIVMVGATFCRYSNYTFSFRYSLVVLTDFTAFVTSRASPSSLILFYSLNLKE